MKPLVTFAIAAAAAALIAGLGGAGLAQQPVADPDAARFDAEGRFLPPANYRDWVFLSSGVDMSYSTAPAMEGAHMFDNVFAPRAAYEAFKRDGKWPDKTVLILETRGGAEKGSITKRGVFQTTQIMGMEAHVKDEARFKGGWGFFDVNGANPQPQIPYTAACYACHDAHAAADKTFVQFYPTLLPIATALKTLNPRYLADPDPVVVK
jgi:hypothetical protein